MSFPLRYAVLLDGGFVVKKLQQASATRAFPSADEIEQLCSDIAAHPDLADYDLLRNYFYHATPAKDVVTTAGRLSARFGGDTYISSAPQLVRQAGNETAFFSPPRRNYGSGMAPRLVSDAGVVSSISSDSAQ